MGGQAKHYKDSPKVSLKIFGIDIETWEAVVTEVATWHRAIYNGAIWFESNRLNKAQKRAKH